MAFWFTPKWDDVNIKTWAADWSSLLLSLHQKHKVDLFYKVRHVMMELIDLRRQLLSGHLTQDQSRDVKRHITVRLDWGNEWGKNTSSRAFSPSTNVKTCRVEPERKLEKVKQQLRKQFDFQTLPELSFKCFFVLFFLSETGGWVFMEV